MGSKLILYIWHHNLSRSYLPVNNITEPLVGRLPFCQATCLLMVRYVARTENSMATSQHLLFFCEISALLRHNIVRDTVTVNKVFSIRMGSVCKGQIYIQNNCLFQGEQIFAHSMMEKTQCNQPTIRWLTGPLMLMLAPEVGTLSTRWW